MDHADITAVYSEHTSGGLMLYPSLPIPPMHLYPKVWAATASMQMPVNGDCLLQSRDAYSFRVEIFTPNQIVILLEYRLWWAINMKQEKWRTKPPNTLWIYLGSLKWSNNKDDVPVGTNEQIQAAIGLNETRKNILEHEDEKEIVLHTPLTDFATA